MEHQAVIFDLFGTLAHNFEAQGYGEALVQMALSLSLPPEDFRRAWFSTSGERNSGVEQSCEADVRHICRQFEMTPDDEQVELAVQARLDYIRQVMAPQPEAGETLAALRKQGYKTGLISDCTHEVPTVWPETIFAPLIDEAVFSCDVGLRKPDPRIYRLATERLGVRPEDCLFIGDGGSRELSGAREVGMHPVLIRVDADSDERHLANREEWDGAAISSLPEVLDLAR